MNKDIKRALNILEQGCENLIIRKDLVRMLTKQIQGFENTLDMAADHVAELQRLGLVMATWIDIKNKKPENGVNVLVAYKFENRSCISLANFAGKYELEADNEAFGDMIDYSEKDDVYYAPEGWYESSDHYQEFGNIYMPGVNVTHWMPKPDFPET